MTEPTTPATQCAEFVPDAPRAPGLCATCGDARSWHQHALAQWSPEREAGIRQRENAATSGPWHVETHAPTLSRLVVSEDNTLVIDFGYVGNRTQDDAEFVAHAPEDISALLAELDKARTERDELRAALDRARTARRRVSSALVAVAPLLDQPYPDDPRWTPWTRFVRPAMAELREALTPVPLCGRTQGVSGKTYPPCARPAGHREAYCRSGDGGALFLAAAQAEEDAS
ncbi:hypothetical protein [Streptomyces sp. NPDC019937]|uniref:hypothetical protein n=1 Tax=Streptomyces sp. NPDC019937 TaxID=3154787 RepID=UPI0033CFC5BB